MRVFHVSGNISVKGSNNKFAAIKVDGKIVAPSVNEAGNSTSLETLIGAALKDYVSKNLGNKDAARLDLRSMTMKDIGKRGLMFQDMNK
jgi:hypothetical protein